MCHRQDRQPENRIKTAMSSTVLLEQKIDGGLSDSRFLPAPSLLNCISFEHRKSDQRTTESNCYLHWLGEIPVGWKERRARGCNSLATLSSANG